MQVCAFATLQQNRRSESWDLNIKLPISATGSGDAPAQLVPGVSVYAVESLASFVLPAELYQKGYDKDVAEDAEGEEEVAFSDDEKVNDMPGQSLVTP